MTRPGEEEVVANLAGQAGGADGISIEKVGHAFPTKDGGSILVLGDVSFSVPNGQFLAVVGASGCGKTTILNMAAGLVRPVSGRVRVGGKDVVKPLRDTGYMFARDGLLPWRSALKNVEVGLEHRGVPKAERRERALKMLDIVGLSGFGDSYPAQLSQGMRQRVAIARTLAINPATLLMDEPFAALDAQTKLALQAEFLKIWEKDRQTVMFVTHDLAEAVSMADRVIVLTSRPGRIHAEFEIDLPRPRDPAEIRFDEGYLRQLDQVWHALKEAEERAG
ncbi:ABC transporter ATP-binding protein [Sinisalibacter aestuarii]|uniref:ABC transporter ATP-binding protein n=1 Tax=Sinisalibacter aestuarii TaxID=2949426 RepID=A0ABQ5M085_9RHOB|nr:ABC transporter ATP-binding protein [Sinisalibacter aestuarii]GKY89902.1 ABC transporter ATP-binding protein [Sinisalibacter aestuarii]